MHKVALIYNPAAGTRRSRRRADVEQTAAVFRRRGMGVELIATDAPGSAGPQALSAIRSGCDAVVCCGGDGTVHDAAQALVKAGADIPVGVIPLGTGNGLAAELRIPRSPAAAAEALLKFRPRRVAVGCVEWGAGAAAQSRYFLISAGVGADAEMLYRISTETKARHGLRAYYASAVRLFATYPFPPLEVEYVESATGRRCREIVAQVLAGRIERFGGMVSRLTPGASLLADDMRLVLFRAPQRLPILAHASAAVLRRSWRIPQVHVVSASEATCRLCDDASGLPANWKNSKLGSRVYAQADGELLGQPPIRLTMVPQALTLLMP